MVGIRDGSGWIRGFRWREEEDDLLEGLFFSKMSWPCLFLRLRLHGLNSTYGSCFCISFLPVELKKELLLLPYSLVDLVVPPC